LEKEKQEWNEYTLDEVKAILGKWKTVLGDRVKLPEISQFYKTAESIPYDLRTPAAYTDSFIASVRLTENYQDQGLSNIIYNTVRAIYNYEISYAIGLPYYSGCINRPILEYITNQIPTFYQLCDTLDVFLLSTSHIRQLLKSEKIFKIPAVFSEIVEDWSSTKSIDPHVNGRDKVSQKWSFKSEPLWKGCGINSKVSNLIPG